MSNSMQRLIHLFTTAGIDADKEFAKAEICAYCAGIELIENQLQKSIEKIFIASNDCNDISAYIDLLGLSNNLPIDEMKSEIIERLSAQWGYLDNEMVSEIVNEFNEMSYYILNNEICFSNIGLNELKLFSNLINSVIPCNMLLSYNGLGLSFEAWDRLAYNWNYYDSLCLPFDIIDYLEDYIYE